MSVEGQSPTDKLLTQISTTLWGAFGNNGLNRTSQEHGRQIGELYERTENLSTALEKRMGALYRMIATLTVSMLVGTIGIIATLVVTR